MLNDVLVSLLQINVSWIIVLHLDSHTNMLDLVVILIGNSKLIEAEPHIFTHRWIMFNLRGQVSKQCFINMHV
jgi:hypothetical protein